MSDEQPKPGTVAAAEQVEYRFSRDELVEVLKRFSLPRVTGMRVFARGSRRSPKIYLTTQRGDFLLKRRAPGQDEPRRVAFDHQIQLLLGQKRYPVAALVRVAGSGNTGLVLNGKAYEIFEFIPGGRLTRTPGEVMQTGRALGLLHEHLKGLRSTLAPPVTSYHNAAGVDGCLAKIPRVLSQTGGAGAGNEAVTICQFLRNAYHQAAELVERAGFRGFPVGVVHGDWHPGNLIFREGKLAGVVDFDCARMEPRVTDVANALLQFSIKVTDRNDPTLWPAELDVEVMQGLLRGYDDAAGRKLIASEHECLPWLIVEDVIVEAIGPIAAAGTFAGIPGLKFLDMVARKVRWVQGNADRVAGAAG